MTAYIHENEYGTMTVGKEGSINALLPGKEGIYVNPMLNKLWQCDKGGRSCHAVFADSIFVYRIW